MGLPSLGLWMDAQPFDNCEKRALATLDKTNSIPEYFKNLESYCKDRAAFRNVLAHISSTLKMRLFRSSPQEDKAIKGKNNWSYYTIANDAIIDSYAHTDLFTPEEVQKRIEGWKLRSQQLARSGISYHVAIWPNKPTIYPEHLPYQLSRLQLDTLSKLDQLVSESSAQQFELLDVRQLLFTQKSDQLYHKNDSHWNDLGAFYAYQALMKQMKLEPYQLSDFDLTWQHSSDGDLLALMGLCNSQHYTDQVPILTFKGKSTTRKIIPEDGSEPYFDCNLPTTDKTLVMFRDSYSTALAPYISLHFKTSYYPWSYYKEEVVKKLKPNYVISANVERRI